MDDVDGSWPWREMRTRVDQESATVGPSAAAYVTSSPMPKPALWSRTAFSSARLGVLMTLGPGIPTAHRKSTRKDSKWYFPNKENLFFPIADGRIKTPGGDQELRTSTLVRHRPIQGESNLDFLGESEGSLPQPRDSFPDAGEAINDFWSMSGSFIFRHRVEPRVKLYSPREESFPTPLKYINVSRTTHTNLDVMQEKRIDDYWNIDGSRDLSDYWTGFKRFILLEEKTPNGYMWSGESLTGKQLTSRPDHLWPELWKSMGKHAKLKEKQKWSEEKLHLEDARKLRGIYFIDPEDTDFKETIKNARKKLETSVALAMPCRIIKNCGSDASNKIKTKLACTLEADCVWEIHYHIIMKTILQEKVTIHYCIIIWCTNTFLCLKLWRFPQQKQQWIKNGRSWKRFRRGTWRKSEVRKRWSMKQGRRAQKFISPHWWTYVIWKMLTWRHSTKNTKVELYSEATLWKTILDFFAVFTGQGSSASQMTAAKVMDVRARLPGCAGQAADAISAYTQVKMEDAPTVLKIPKLECPDTWIRLQKHKWPKSWSSMEDPVVLLERNLYGHPLTGLLWERQIEKVLLGHGWEKTSKLGMLFSLPKRKDSSCLCMWTTSNWLERNKTLIRCGKYSIKKMIWENQHISLIMFVWVALNENVKQAKILKTNTEICLNPKSLLELHRSYPTLIKHGANISSWSYDIEGHAKKCVERYCELANKTTQQVFKVATPCMHWRPPIHGRRNEICRRIAKGLLENSSKMRVLGPHW